MTASIVRVPGVRRRSQARIPRDVRLCVVLLVAALVMHGCHGADVDHEPLVKPPETQSAAPEGAAD